MLPVDLPIVAVLGIAAKQSWGYDAAQMKVFANELTLSPQALGELLVAELACRDESIVGYYTIRQHTAGTAELEHLFVAPDHFHQGIGSCLLQRARKTGADCGYAKLIIIADPHSAGFYEKHGARKVGDHRSSIPGRIIPIYELDTKE